MRKYSSQITHATHMTITTSGQILPCPNYRKTKENLIIILLDLHLFTFYSVHANECVHMALAIDRQTWYPPDVR